ncbi:MAG: hypothetical protein JNM63_13440, partial [Spirochaetia bacterium]|nr:hypothetical protein [Spirochaetia bacterium]
MIKIFRHPQADYYHNDIPDSPKFYQDDYLIELKKNGFNAIWMAGILRDLCRTSAVPEWGADKNRNVEALRKTVDQCARHDVKVFIYLNEPRGFALSSEIVSRHPDLVGQRYQAPFEAEVNGGPECFAMCASSPKTLQYLEEGTRDLFREVPGLGGLILITASEHVTTCHSRAFYSELDIYSKISSLTCPRCQKGDRSVITSKIINAIHAGTTSADPKAKVIAWNWSWSATVEKDPQKRLISLLHPSIAIMGDFERGDLKKINGKNRKIDEYSRSYSGPSERFKQLRKETLRQKREVFIKLQIGTTHEIATVNHLPLLSNLHEKIDRVKAVKPAGIMGTWNFGNFFSINTFSFNFFLDRKLKEESVDLAALCESYFENPPERKSFAKAMKLFRKAFDSYPFSIPFLYFSPINYAPAFPLDFPEPEKPMAGSWVKAEWGFRLTDSFGDYKANEIIACLKKVSEFWERGVGELEKSFSLKINSSKESDVFYNAVGILHILKSAYHIYASWPIFLRAQKAGRPVWKDSAFQKIAKNEISHLNELIPIFNRIPNYGRHNECQVDLFTQKMVEE